MFERENVLNGVALVVAILYCAFPVLLSLALLNVASSENGGLAETAKNFLSIQGVNPLQTLLIPVLGAITIFKGESLRSGLSAALLAILISSFALAVFGYVSALGPRGALFVPTDAKDTTAASLALKSFLESTALMILILLGLRAGPGGQPPPPKPEIQVPVIPDPETAENEDAASAPAKTGSPLAMLPGDEPPPTLTAPANGTDASSELIKTPDDEDTK
jgi:hypothetical protein